MSTTATGTDPSLDTNATNDPPKFLGKYRGVVINNVDPMQIGRIQVIVPDVSTFLPTSWAMPCVPIGGMQMGVFGVPQLGAGVWVEFEQGDPDYPIWVGCYYGAAEVPILSHLAPPAVAAITLQTTLQNGIIISDVPGPTGGIMLKSALGATLIVNDTGIYIQNGKGAMITLIGPAIAMNEGALTVM
jgi:Type VI secretion system/phage-baseplate injector OB domain